jgi:alkylated DNA repair dioxygenase AlkB
LQMTTLFPLTIEESEVPQILGLSYLADFISAREQETLVAVIDEQPWNTTWERRRQFYGSTYGHEEGLVQPLPNWGLLLIDRMLGTALVDRPFDHMLVDEYLPGQGIAFHRDYSSFDRTVVSLSLLSPCVMEFREPKTRRLESLLLAPRSLLVLSDAARYKWQHGIARRKRDRWQGRLIIRGRRLSVTFRHRRSSQNRRE